MMKCNFLTAYRSIAIAVQLNHIREQREYQSRAISIHISLLFRHANFCLLEDFLPSPVYLIVDISNYTSKVPRKREPRDSTGKQLLNIFILPQFLLTFVIGDDRKENEGRLYMRFSRLDAHLLRITYLDIFDILEDVSPFTLCFLFLLDSFDFPNG